MNKITVEITSKKVLTEYDIRKALEFLYEENMEVSEIRYQDTIYNPLKEAYEL